MAGAVAGARDHADTSICKIAKRERAINAFARVTQFLDWPIAFLVFGAFFRVRIAGRENFKAVKSPFLIVSNHIAFYDSFLFRLALGLFTPHLPLRFMAVDKFEWKFLNFLASIGVIEFVYSLFGVFIVVPGLGIERNLEKAKEIIKVGGNVAIYPEGKIFTRGGIGQFKKGAAVLAKHTGVPVVPVAFRLGPKHWLRRELSINIGAPVRMSPRDSDESAAGSLRDAVTKLYESAIHSPSARAVVQ